MTTMKNQEISEAYAEVIREIESFAVQLNGKRGTFIAAGEFDAVSAIIKADEQLRSTASRLEKLRRTFLWNLGRKSGADRESLAVKQGEQDTGRATRTRLKVTIPGGRVIQEDTAAQTFAEVIEHLGMDRVAALGWRVNDEPLLSQHPSQNYNQQKVGHWYVMTHSNTNYKKRILDGLATQLGVPLSVEIVF